MSERDLSRPRRRPTAYETLRGDRVVRRPERPLARQAPRSHARCAVHLGDFERLLEHGRREDPGQPPRQHGLARTGRADHEQVVPTGGRDLECALGVRLAAHVGKVEWRAVLLRARGTGLCPGRAPSARAAGRPVARAWVWAPTRARRPPAPPPARCRTAPAASGSARPGRRARRPALPAPAGSRRSARARRPARTRRAPRAGTWPLATSTPTAMARSKLGPVLWTWAGARLTVILWPGNSSPELSSAARTRSRDSRMARSGRPTSVNVGSPLRTSTSTVTSWLRTPSRVKVATAASTTGTLGRRDAPVARANVTVHAQASDKWPRLSWLAMSSQARPHRPLHRRLRLRRRRRHPGRSQGHRPLRRSRDDGSDRGHRAEHRGRHRRLSAARRGDRRAGEGRGRRHRGRRREDRHARHRRDDRGCPPCARPGTRRAGGPRPGDDRRERRAAARRGRSRRAANGPPAASDRCHPQPSRGEDPRWGDGKR